MIQYSNNKQHNISDFKEYLSIEGYSHSGLKSLKSGVSMPFNVTDKVKIGKIVDEILTGGTPDYSSEFYPTARKIANKLHERFGHVLSLMDNQVAFTATMQLGGLEITGKGILDKLLPKRLVLDLKITHEKDVMALCKYMGYENQVWHYARLAQVSDGFLYVYSVKTGESRLIRVDVANLRNEFWEDAILMNGRAAV